MADKLTQAAKQGESEFLKAYYDYHKITSPNDTDSANAYTAFVFYSSVAGSKKQNNRINPSMSMDQVIGKIIKTQTGKQSTKYEAEFTGMEDAIELIYDSSEKKVRSFKDIMLNLASEGLSQVLTYFEEQKDLQQQINEQTSLTGDMSRDFRDSIMDASVYANRLGIPFEEVSKGMSKLIQDAGRFKLIGESTINNISEQSKVFFDSFDGAVDSLEHFQNVSRGVDDAMRATDKAGKSSLSLGLNAKTSVKTMVENLEKLNQFGFKNGIEGLSRMIQKAQSLRMDLGDSFKLADKVMDPTNALSLAANLQVIGGALGDFNDPIKMMYMATNNVEGLQDALAETAESLVTFNDNSGVFEIVGADLRRAHAMAKELDMDLDHLTNLAVQSAQRTSAAVDLMSTGLILEDDDREFLTNIAQMDEGQMVITTKDERGEDVRVALETMTQEQAKYLLSQKEQFEEMSTYDIARNQVSLIQNIERDMSFIVALARVEAGKTIDEKVFQNILGVDPKTAGMLTRGLADAAQEGIIDIVSQMKGDGIKDLVSDLTSKNKESVATSTQPQSTTTDANVNLTITGGVSFDVIMRAIKKDPELASRLARAFTNQIRTND